MTTVYTTTILILFAIITGLLVVIFRLWRQTRQIGLGLDEITEDALKTLFNLTREKPVIPNKDLIRGADLQPARFAMIQAELKRRGWAETDPQTTRILPGGEKRAIELIRAHRLWERYLADKEGLALEALHAEATRREHLTSTDEVDQLEAQLGFPKFDPHGDPFHHEGELVRQHEAGTLLSSWPARRPGRVIHVEDEPPALFTQLALLGLTPGAQIEVDERTPGRVLVWSGRQRLALAPAAADLIYVAMRAERPLSERDRPGGAWWPSTNPLQQSDQWRRWLETRGEITARADHG
jgi:Mn-dependent DtxR family transcriptional regulator/Fe2+ transport system protein FeoA